VVQGGGEEAAAEEIAIAASGVKLLQGHILRERLDDKSAHILEENESSGEVSNGGRIRV
jgi:hypothetical protein